MTQGLSSVAHAGRSLLIALLAALALAGCHGEGAVDDPTGGVPRPPSRVEGLSVELTRAYLGALAPVLAGRVLTAVEREQIDRDGGAAIRPLLEGWTAEPGFVEAARAMMEARLAVSGMRDGIDFNLPGNTVAHVVGSALPWAEVLRAESCFTADGTAMPCDTGAPYAAGVLATRAFMSSRAGRFNLTRAGTLLVVFSCMKYPVPNALEPKIDRARLLEMFQATGADDQTVDAAKAGFGNGLACYSCHGQFGPHAQLFVRFDRAGMWHADATGLQSTEPGAQLGESTNGLMTSHLKNPAEAADERSQMFGEPVANLAEAARVVSESEPFRSCAVRSLLEYSFGLDRGAEVDGTLLSRIADEVSAEHDDPSLQQLAVATFADPVVAHTAALALVESDAD